MNQSRILRGILKGGEARFFLCDTTAIAQEARTLNNARNTCTAAMGRMLSAVSMMGIGLKDGQDRISATISGGGPAGAMTAVAGANGVIKITVENPGTELPLKANGAFDVGGYLGKNGQLTVIRSNGFSEPYIGRTNLVSGEIGEDFALYYLESEQIPSLCALGTKVRNTVESSAGILIQAMPSFGRTVESTGYPYRTVFGNISNVARYDAGGDCYRCIRRS